MASPLRTATTLRRRAASVCVSMGLALALLGGASVARAEGLSEGDTARLDRGETVIREQTLELGDRRYVGGLTYTVVDASIGELASVFEDVDAYRKVLPRTKRARLLAQRGGDRFIEVVQGTALVETSYTVRVRAESPGSDRTSEGVREVRFWLEPSLPHGIEDAWGFFRMQPFIGPNGVPRVLLTYGVLVDMGPGIVRDLFEERVRGALLRVPDLVRRYVAEVRRTYY